ncbi:hypothetical protein PA39016_000460029 [Pseudomonas aeruginosa 39016]|nr:hypothetical protein PA39016_000460029 [Pseudomonas aeruginosa 39016]
MADHLVVIGGLWVSGAHAMGFHPRLYAMAFPAVGMPGVPPLGLV